VSGAALAGALSTVSAVLAAAAFRARSRAAIRTRAAAPAVGSTGRHGRMPALDVSGRGARVALALAGSVSGYVLAGVPGAAVGIGGGLILPTVARRRRSARARTTLEEQLADAASSIGAGLRAGLSLPQAIRYAADEGEPPLAGELRGVVDRSALGEPLGTAVDAWAEAQGGRDVRLVAGGLRLHRRSGGDLPTVLDRLSETLRERRSAAREIRSLTAQARMSGAILGLLPIAFFAFLAVTSREDLETALRSTTGLTAILVGLGMQGAAFLWIRHLLRVE